MKIYEIRDMTDSETYYPQGFFSTKEKAVEKMEEVKNEFHEDDGEDIVTICLFEHELDSNNDGYGKNVLEKVYKNTYKENEEGNDEWEEITNPKGDGMKKLKRDVMNVLSNFETSVRLCTEHAMSKKDFKKYKLKYNTALEQSTNKILTLFWNSVGEII